MTATLYLQSVMKVIFVMELHVPDVTKWVDDQLLRNIFLKPGTELTRYSELGFLSVQKRPFQSREKMTHGALILPVNQGQSGKLRGYRLNQHFGHIQAFGDAAPEGCVKPQEVLPGLVDRCSIFCGLSMTRDKNPKGQGIERIQAFQPDTDRCMGCGGCPIMENQIARKQYTRCPIKHFQIAPGMPRVAQEVDLVIS